MPEPTARQPQPTGRDVENAAMREAIARKQAEEYGECLRWALGAFGPGWLPSCRHMLIAKDEEEKHRRTGEKAIPAATVFTVKHEETGQRRHFTVEGGKVKECSGYEEGFGPMLLEPDPVRGFTDQKGVFHHTHRYSLCWAGYELYHPRSAEQLAALRASRERGKAEREERRWAEENPLLAWADRQARQEDGPEGAAPTR